MSVVVIRNGIIAADTQSMLGDIKYKTRKLHKLNNTIIGTAGNKADEETFVWWYFGGHDLEAIPEFHNHSGSEIQFSAIVLEPHGWAYWNDWFVEDKSMGELNEYMAIGIGREAAMGALHMGASAIEAVEAACATITGCSLPVEWEEVQRRMKVAEVNQ